MKDSEACDYTPTPDDLDQVEVAIKEMTAMFKEQELPPHIVVSALTILLAIMAPKESDIESLQETMLSIFRKKKSASNDS